MLFDPDSGEKAIIPALKGRGLYPYRITDLAQEYTRRPKFASCSATFITSVLDFLQTAVVEPAAEVREAYGMIAALIGTKEWDETSDLSSGATSMFPLYCR